MVPMKRRLGKEGSPELLSSTDGTGELNGRRRVSEPPLQVLHVGCGVKDPNKLHPVFRSSMWRETRLDIDERVAPNIVASVVDMKDVKSRSFDAIWCSHTLEHLQQHEVLPTLREFVRVLKSSGFALIRAPDIEAAAEILLQKGPNAVVYNSPAGPITPLDMIYGHTESLERGNHYMRHGTGFTQDIIGRLLIKAGFEEARAIRVRNSYEVVAIGLAASPDQELMRAFRSSGYDFGSP